MNANFKNIVMRVDSSTTMGTGHLMRCLTLADELLACALCADRCSRGVQVSFVCRDLPGNLTGLISEKKYILYNLPPALEPKQTNPLSNTRHIPTGWA